MKMCHQRKQQHHNTQNNRESTILFIRNRRDSKMSDCHEKQRPHAGSVKAAEDLNVLHAGSVKALARRQR
jgi:hypothetical protein